MKRQHLRYLPLLAASAVLLVNCGGESGSTQKNGPGRLIPAVEAVQARHGSLPLSERLSGVVEAKNQVEIYPEISAVVMQVHAQNGDVVRRGAPLVQLRDTEFRERLKQARAALQIANAQVQQTTARNDKAQADLARSKALFEKQLVTDAELETSQAEASSAQADLALARARVEQAQATIDEQQEALDRTTVRAPIDGTVGGRSAEVGMYVTSNSRLFTIGQLDSVRVEVILTDRMLGYIEQGQRSEIHSATSAIGSMAASLTRISPFLHPVTHSTEAEIDLANPGQLLKPGMFVTVEIFHGESEQATLIPMSALYENPGTGGTGVFVTRSDISREPTGSSTTQAREAIALTEPVPFTFVPVEVVARGRMTAGVRGIDEGAWVVTIGQDLLSGDSAQARVRPVDWEWVERLQNLQREDLLEEVMKRQQEVARDTTA